jgi:hypothetical protein
MEMTYIIVFITILMLGFLYIIIRKPRCSKKTKIYVYNNSENKSQKVKPIYDSEVKPTYDSEVKSSKGVNFQTQQTRTKPNNLFLKLANIQIFKNILPNNNVLPNTLPNNSLPNNVLPNNVLPNNVLPNNVLPNTLPNNTLPSNFVIPVHNDHSKHVQSEYISPPTHVLPNSVVQPKYVMHLNNNNLPTNGFRTRAKSKPILVPPPNNYSKFHSYDSYLDKFSHGSEPDSDYGFYVNIDN